MLYLAAIIYIIILNLDLLPDAYRVQRRGQMGWISIYTTVPTKQYSTEARNELGTYVTVLPCS